MGINCKLQLKFRYFGTGGGGILALTRANLSSVGRVPGTAKGSELRMNIKGLLFDKDGTLFDFHATWAGAVETFFDRLAPSPEVWSEIAAVAGYDGRTRRFVPGSLIVADSNAEIATTLARFRPDLTISDVEALANAAFSEAASQGCLQPAVADLPALLSSFKAQGIALGVATHDSEAAAVAHLQAAGALELFDFIAGYDSGHGLKPGPGMLTAFAAATGLAAHEIAMVGDSVHDLMVAPNAGAAMAIGVLTGPAEESDLAVHADHILASIGDLPALLARL